MKGVIPKELYKANAFPQLKEMSRAAENNCQHLSTLSVWSKKNDRTRHNRAYSYLELPCLNKIASAKKLSTIDALAERTEKKNGNINR